MITAPSRPLLRYHGGKWRLAPWIISHFPPHRVYVEPFGGAASVLLRKPRSYAEVYNDLDGDLVNLFRVLQDKIAAERLRELLQVTPFARAEFELSYQEATDTVERARRLIIRSFMGFGSNGHNPIIKTGFRSNSNRSGTTPAHDWMHYPDSFNAFVDRLAGVVIENRDYRTVCRRHDSPETLFYVDPPYMWETRSSAMRRNHYYFHELDTPGHAILLEFIRSLSGAVILSGYPHPLYDDMLAGWTRIEKESLADGARKRTEVLWIKPGTLSQKNLYEG